MTSFVMSPQVREMIARAKAGNGTSTCDPRAMYPAGHRCAGTTQPIKPQVRQYIKLGQPIDAGGVPVPDKAIIVRETRTPTGGATTTVETGGGDTVDLTTAANGAVEKVEVKNKWLMPAAIAAAAFILFGG